MIYYAPKKPSMVDESLLMSLVEGLSNFIIHLKWRHSSRLEARRGSLSKLERLSGQGPYPMPRQGPLLPRKSRMVARSSCDRIAGTS